MILSLLLASAIFVPIIGLVGITEQGEDLFSGGELLASANTTVWNTFSSVYSAFGLATLIPIVGGFALIIGVIIYCLSKASKPKT